MEFIMEPYHNNSHLALLVSRKWLFVFVIGESALSDSRERYNSAMLIERAALNDHDPSLNPIRVDADNSACALQRLTNMHCSLSSNRDLTPPPSY